MRRLAPVILLLAAAGCSRGLKKSDAETAIRARYPVTVPVRVPGRVSADPKSQEGIRAQAFQNNLEKTGWFDITREEGKGGRTVWTFTPKPGAPVQPSGTGWLVPAAQAVFVKATHHAEQGKTAKVTYQIQLAQPTAQFPLFQMLHPTVPIGDTKLRHAVFQQQGGAWALTGTDETFGKE